MTVAKIGDAMRVEDIKFYQIHGYLTLKDIFSQQCINDLISAVDEISTNKNIMEQYKHLYDYENLRETKLKVLRRIQSPEIINPIFRKIGENSRLLENLSHLLGKNIRLERIKIHMKQASYGSEISWHQDWAYQAYTNDDIMSVGIFLDDCTENNGPVYIIPGTHLGPIYPHEKSGVFSGFIDVSKHNINTSTRLPLTGNAGIVTLHHYRMVHFSPSNTSDKPRRLLLLRYAAADAWPLMGILDYKNGFSLEKMKARIVLGQQTLEPRLKEVPVRMPMPYPETFG